MIKISTRGAIFQRLSLSKLLLLSILVLFLSTAYSCSEEPNTDDGQWIDSIFAQVLQDKGYISDAATVTPDDVAHIETLNVSGFSGEYPGSITSLKGIEYFRSLRSLDCRNNKITKLDLSKNLNLNNLNCRNNKITKLDLSKNSNLDSLDCSVNEITKLDLSKNINLEYCDCSWNELTQLELSNLTKLWYLMCKHNRLTRLDVSNTGLRILDLWINQLSNLKLNTQLEVLNCSRNQLRQLDVSICTQLYQLNCDDNQLTQLDISNSTQLETLSCSENQLVQLDISKSLQLKSLFCSINPGKNGKFPIKAWFDNSNVPIDLKYDVVWMYNGSTVVTEFYK